MTRAASQWYKLLSDDEIPIWPLLEQKFHAQFSSNKRDDSDVSGNSASEAEQINSSFELVL